MAYINYIDNKIHPPTSGPKKRQPTPSHTSVIGDLFSTNVGINAANNGYKGDVGLINFGLSDIAHDATTDLLKASGNLRETKGSNDHHRKFESAAGNGVFSFNNNGDLQKLSFSPNSTELQKVLNAATKDETGGKSDTPQALSSAIADRINKLPLPEQASARRALEEGIGTLRKLNKPWNISYNKDGDVNGMTVGGEAVKQGSALWQAGSLISETLQQQATQAGILNPSAPIPDTQPAVPGTREEARAQPQKPAAQTAQRGPGPGPNV